MKKIIRTSLPDVSAVYKEHAAAEEIRYRR